MTKQQTIDQIKNSLPGFYSAEQVIEMLTKIEEPKSQAPAFNLETIIEEVESRMSRRLENNSDDLVDNDSAEFSFYNGNQIELSSVDVHIDTIVEYCSEIVTFVLSNEFGIEDNSGYYSADLAQVLSDELGIED